MKVDYIKNLWIDYGINKGGTLIDLVIKLEKLDFYKSAKLLTGKHAHTSYSFHGNNEESILHEKASLKIVAVRELTNPVLLSYLMDRRIEPAIAQTYCSEVYYSVNGQTYYAIGLKNESGGYELRNKYFKGCFPPKDITHIKASKEDCNVYEGMMDFLSFLTIKQLPNTEIAGMPDTDHLVLNSVLSISKAIEPLKAYRTITCYLDNDQGGEKAFNELKKHHPHVIDGSGFYKGHKDMNEFIIDKKILSVKEKKNTLVTKPRSGPKSKRRFRR